MTNNGWRYTWKVAMFVNCIFLVTLYCCFAKRRSLVSKLNSPVRCIVIRDSDVSKAHQNFLFCYLMLFRVYHQKGSAYVPYLYHNNHTCMFDIRANTHVRTLFIHSFNIKMVTHWNENERITYTVVVKSKNMLMSSHNTNFNGWTNVIN